MNQPLRIGVRPKWPMSAYSASPPVTARNTDDRVTKPHAVVDEETHRVQGIDRQQHVRT